MAAKNKKKAAKKNFNKIPAIIEETATKQETTLINQTGKKQNFLILDGYNVIHSETTLKAIAADSLENARDKLINIMQNYQGITNYNVIIVFDAHKVKKGVGTSNEFGNVAVIYTKEAETADHYIERTAYKSKYEKKSSSVTVVTNDGEERGIVIGSGAMTLSVNDLFLDIKEAENKIAKQISDAKPIKNNTVADNLSSEIVYKLEKMRRGIP